MKGNDYQDLAMDELDLDKNNKQPYIKKAYIDGIIQTTSITTN